MNCDCYHLTVQRYEYGFDPTSIFQIIGGKIGFLNSHRSAQITHIQAFTRIFKRFLFTSYLHANCKRKQQKTGCKTMRLGTCYNLLTCRKNVRKNQSKNLQWRYTQPRSHAVPFTFFKCNEHRFLKVINYNI